MIKIPDTPAGKQLAAWLEVYNSGDKEKQRQFIASQYAAAALKKDSVGRRLGGFQMVYYDNRKVVLAKIERSTDQEIEALVRSPLTESWLRISLKVEKDAPHGITETRITFTDAPVDKSEHGKLTDAEIAQRVEAYVGKMAAADLFSGTVLLARDGKPFLTKACGLASRAFSAPNRLDTKFNLGSMNKMFTAVAVAQLAQQGKLTFDDPLIKHLPDYPNKEIAGKITIHQLLTHTSGLGDYFTDKFMETSKDRFRTIQDFFPLFVDKPLAGEPGKEFRYSNAGFLVLGAVVAKVSSENYFDYVRNHIYKPAGMVNTDAYEMDRDTPNLAIGYTQGHMAGPGEPEGLRNNLFLHVVKGGPAGGGFSTVEDLARFAAALQNGKLLDKKHADLVLTGKVAMGRRGNAKYAYGFFDDTSRGTRIVGHGGGFPGINSQLDIYVDRGYTVAVMSNYDPPAAQRIADKAKALITQE
jgi:CubicO group peptidase (beta-lactamase class C family)